MKIASKWIHKDGGEYEIIDEAITIHTEPLVFYRAIGKDREYVRTKSHFLESFKPKKQEFCIGDWITNGTHTIQVVKDHEWTGVHDSYKHWEPKVGDWCLFFDDDDYSHYTLDTLLHIQVVHKHYILQECLL